MGAEKKSIGVDDRKLIPYKQHPSTAHTDEETPESSGSEARSVSENWIAKRITEDVIVRGSTCLGRELRVVERID